MKFTQQLFAAILLISSATASAGKLEDAISERLTPVGNVCVEGEQCAAATASASGGGSSEPRSGEAVYNGACTACHSTGAAGAPKLGDAADWAARTAGGVEAVYANAIGGVGAMPPKGLCMDCSDDEIKLAVDYILDGSR